MRRDWIAALAATALIAGLGATARPASSPALAAEPAPATAPTGLIFKTVIAGEISLKYVVYVPRDYDTANPLPAIVFLHGQGECGSDGQKQIMVGIGTNVLWNAARWPCIVLMPQKPDSRKQWEAYDAQIMAMLDAAKKEYAIDPARVSLTGLSQGGHGTWALGALHPEVWCALAPICGYAEAHGGNLKPEAIAAKVKGIPVWCFHGEADDIVPPAESRNVVDAIKAARQAGGGAGPEPRLTTYPNANHNSWDKAYAEAELPGFLMKPRGK